MKPGDLVKTTRARIGVPNNTIGLITERHVITPSYQVFVVQLTEHPEYGTRTIRSLSLDLEVISASR
jgi:hypothetical protein